MFFNCGVGEDSWESLGLQGDPNQSILKEISPEYSLKGLMLKLKLQYFVYLIWRTDSLEKTLMLRKIKGGRRRGRQRMRWWMASPTRWTWVWASSGVVDGQGGLVYCSPWGRNELDTTEGLNWTEVWPWFNKFLLLCPRVETTNSLPISCPSTCDTICLSGFFVLTLLNRMFCLLFIPNILLLYVYLIMKPSIRTMCSYSHFSFSDGRPHKQTFYKSLLNEWLNESYYTKLFFLIMYFMFPIVDWELLKYRQKYPCCPTQ